MNDPNGLLEFDGRTHLFYQHNPQGAFHDCIHWGHAVTDDLVHWEHLPIALAPTTGGPDESGCWSGCAVVQDGVPTLIYTGISPQVQCLATTSDGLITWDKHPGNPIVSSPPAGVDVIGDPPEIRDPWVWRDDGRWHMLLGSGVRRGQTGGSHEPEGVLLLYRSDDLRSWDFVGIAHRGRFAEGTAIWECPNLFRLGERHVLLVSEQREFTHTYYQVGDFDGRKFHDERTGKTDHGKFFYAALTLGAEDGRRIMWGWLKEGRTEQAQRDAGWAGVMSLPRVLELRQDGALGMRPIPELEDLRGARSSLSPRRLTAGDDVDVPELRGDALELRIRAEVSPRGVLTVTLRRSDDRSEETVLRYDGGTGSLTLDTRRSSLASDVTPEKVAVEHPTPGGILDLRVFLDRSVIEVFANEQTCVTGRIYPSRSDSQGVSVGCEGGDVELLAFDGWPMRSIW